MPTIERGPPLDIVLNGEVCAAISMRFSSSAEPPTRLFWV
jgi:hypothetical protein